MRPFHYLLYITNALLSSVILSTDRPSRVIKRDEPKGSLPLAYFISASLIVYSVCASVFKEPHSTLYPTSLQVRQKSAPITKLALMSSSDQPTYGQRQHTSSSLDNTESTMAVRRTTTARKARLMRRGSVNGCSLHSLCIQFPVNILRHPLTPSFSS
jgi:hypothetical protein